MTPPESFIRQLHDAPIAYVLCVTGGGSLAISRLLTAPGASRGLLEAAVPYSGAALADWLGAQPERACSPATARLMAMASFVRARDYTRREDLDRQPLGVACTASLASDRPKRGEHRLHVAVQSYSATCTWTLTLEKDARTRLQEEELSASILLNALATAAGLAERLPCDLRPSEALRTHRTDAPPVWQQLVMERGDAAPIGSAPEARMAIFPGAFHPLHDGHRGMAKAAARRLGCPVAFEISVLNVDKPPLDYTEISDRLAQFSPTEGVWLTSAPTFVEKSRCFPGATFVVGWDTIVRIGQERYYGGSIAARDAALESLAAAGCHFLGFGRKTDQGFQSLADAKLPETLRQLCLEVPETEYRADISSTELRKMQLPGG